MPKLTKLSKNVLIVASIFFLDKVLAFARVGLITRKYKDSVDMLDTFNAANNLPDVLFALISGGALAMAFIPLLTETLTNKDRAAAWDLFSRVANVAFLVTGGFAILISIFAEPIVNAKFGIAPGFSAEQRALLAELMRLNLISTLIFSISGLVMASLQANQHFVLPAIAPIMYNVGQVIGVIFLVPLYGIHGLVYGVILGAAFHLAIQIPALIKFGFRWTASLNLRHSGLIEALKLMWPRLLTMGGIQLIMLARDNIASQLGQEGAVSALTYGWMIMQVPETILGTALATAMLPALSELATRRAWGGFRDTVERALQVLIALTLPAAAILAAGIAPLVRAVFGLDEASSTLVTWTTRAYLLMLTGFTIHEVAVRAFYARKEPLYPLYAVLLRVALFLSISAIGLKLFPAVGAPMIALAESALLIEAIVLLWWLSRRTHQPLVVSGAVQRGLVAALIGGGAAYSVAVFVPGGAIVTALLGMSIGTSIALTITWRDVRQVFSL